MGAHMEATGPGSISQDGPLAPRAKSAANTPPIRQQILQCFYVAALATASYLFVSHFLVEGVQVVGPSMSPTLQNSQSYLLNRWVYYLRSPRRFDVIVLRDPADNCCAVKRIIATAGDTIYLKDGAVYVNGRKLNEPYLPPGTQTFPYAGKSEQTFTCAKDQYFVLGDNRTNSADSRTYGVIARSSILGIILH